MAHARAAPEAAVRRVAERSAEAGRKARNGRPLSRAQERIWMGHELAANPAQFNIPLVLRLVGDLVPQALAQSLDAVIERHAILRSTYGLREEELVQTLIASPRSGLAFVDLTQLPETEASREADRLAGAEIARPFDLSRDPMLRPKLIKVSATEFRLVITRHHIASDGWSLGILLREVAHFYRAFCGGRFGRLDDLPIQYADYAQRQRASANGAAVERCLQYWRQQLAGADSKLFEVTAGAAGPPAAAVTHGYLDAGVAAVMRRWCRSCGVTLFQALLAAFLVILYHLTGRTDLVVATDYTQRNHSETEGLIGTFVDRLPLRFKLEGDADLAELARRVGEITFSAHAHAEAPFADIVAAFERPRVLHGEALFHAMFGFHAAPSHAPYRALRMHGLQSCEFLDVSIAHAEFPLCLYLTDTEYALAVEIRHDTRYFSAKQARTLLSQFENVLRFGCASSASPSGGLGVLAKSAAAGDTLAFSRLRASTWTKQRQARTPSGEGGGT
jgi:Condensation domain